MISLIRRLSIPAGFLIILIATACSQAQQPVQTLSATPSDNDVNRVAKNMYCPVCENTPLDMCETQACADWRAEIRRQLSQGWSEQQIYDYFVEQHGDRVLALPPARGLNWLVYLVPPLVIAGGVVVLTRLLLSARRTARSSGISESEHETINPSAEEDDYAARLEEELENRRRK